MKIKGLVDEDFANYRLPSMFIIMPYYSFKCNMYAGYKCCQNAALSQQPNIEISAEHIIQRFINNPITNAIVFGGLEPMDSFPEVLDFISKLRDFTDADVVIYSGYEKHDLEWQIEKLSQFKNIVIKFGRYIPNVNSVYSEVLGVTLASENQFAERIS